MITPGETSLPGESTPLLTLRQIQAPGIFGQISAACRRKIEVGSMSAPRSRIILVVLAAVAVTVFGVVRLIAALGAPGEITAVAEADGLKAQVTTASWSKMDMASQPGFQMPAGMMPGMPDQGKSRLVVSISVTNTSPDTRPLHASDEFALLTGDGDERWAAHSDTFGELPRLAPRNAVNGTLFFDLPAADLTDSPVWVEWKHGATTSRLSVPMSGAETGSNHEH
jgi:hypothetical protein